MSPMPRALAPLAVSLLLLSPGCGDDATGVGDLAGIRVDGGDLASSSLDLLASEDAGVVLGIACGDTPCAANAQWCCTSTQGKTGTCGFGPPADCGSALFYCDGPEDCPPAEPYCCVQNGVASCGSAVCPGTIQGGIAMCHTNADCAKVGLNACCPSTTGGPYRLCLMSCP